MEPCGREHVETPRFSLSAWFVDEGGLETLDDEVILSTHVHIDVISLRETQSKASLLSEKWLWLSLVGGLGGGGLMYSAKYCHTA